MKCDLCGEEIQGGPFTIVCVNPHYRIEHVCGDCMNLYAWGEYNQLVERMTRKKK